MLPNIADRRYLAERLEHRIDGKRNAHHSEDQAGDRDGVDFVEGARGEEGNGALYVAGDVERVLCYFADNGDVGLDGPCGFEGAPGVFSPGEAVLVGGGAWLWEEVACCGVEGW